MDGYNETMEDGLAIEETAKYLKMSTEGSL